MGYPKGFISKEKCVMLYLCSYFHWVINLPTSNCLGLFSSWRLCSLLTRSTSSLVSSIASRCLPLTTCLTKFEKVFAQKMASIPSNQGMCGLSIRGFIPWDRVVQSSMFSLCSQWHGDLLSYWPCSVIHEREKTKAWEARELCYNVDQCKDSLPTVGVKSKGA